MIICDSTQYVEQLQAEVGISCAHVDLISALDHVLTMQSVFEFLQIQWGLYGMFLVFAWSKYAIKQSKL